MGIYSVEDKNNVVGAREALAHLKLVCVLCQAVYPGYEEAPRYRCACGGVLDVEAPLSLPTVQAAQLESAAQDADDYKRLTGAAWRQIFDERATSSPIWPLSPATLLPDRSGVWRYRELILPVPISAIISRPEGNTGLYPVGLENCDEGRVGFRKVGVFAGLERFYLKHEGENPTGSFKDRGMSTGVTLARLRGAKAVACASTGNTSASLASYAAQAGMQGIVFLPSGQISMGKLAQTLAYGATTVQIEGDFDAAMQLVEEVCNELGIYLLNSLNPYRVEGQKAIGLEILQQLDWQAPDWLVLPAGNLGNTSAIGKAFRQAYQLGLISHMPRIASIQAAGANPFYLSYQQNFAHYAKVHADTVASAIKIGDPVSFSRARRVIEETNGVVEQVTDEEILSAKAVIDRSGIGCEPASAAALAGAKKLVARGVIRRDEQVVAVLTGNLLKDSQTGVPQSITGEAIAPTLTAVKKALQM
jgi:threonine synthase